MIPPVDIEAEQHLLATIVADGTIYREAAEKVREADFFEPRHREIWACMAALEKAGTPIDSATVAHALRAKQQSEVMLYLLDLRTVGLPSTMAHWAEKVANAAANRRLCLALHEISTRAATNQERPESLVGEAEAFLRGFDSGAELRQGITMGQALDQLEAELIDMHHRGEHRAFITGDPVIDSLYWVKSTDLFVIGGRPAAGKSFLGVSLARTMARVGKRILLFAAEMTPMDQAARASRAYGDLHPEVFQRPTSEHDVANALEAIGRARKEQGRHIIHTERDFLAVMRIARALIRKRAVDAIVIDFLQRLRFPASMGSNLNERIGDATSSLKQLALDSEVPVFLISSMRRRENEKEPPSMADLRDSGSIESDADAILLLHRTSGDHVDWINAKGRAKRDQTVVPMLRRFERSMFEEAQDSPRSLHEETKRRNYGR